MTSNRPTLAELGSMRADEVAKLPADMLALLVEDVAKLLASAKAYDEKISAALHIKYGALAQQARSAEGKDTGRVRLTYANEVVVADQPKNVTYDQATLARAVAVIRDEWKEDPEDYVQIKYSVPEGRYQAWPQSIKRIFDPARVVKAGKPSYEIIITEHT